MSRKENTREEIPMNLIAALAVVINVLGVVATYLFVGPSAPTVRRSG
jgi:hypothetical protein